MPASVCTTSGWNSTAYTLRASSLIAAAAEVAVCASAVNPGGTLCTESPCDIQTRDSAGTPRNSGESGRSSASCAGPNSLRARRTSSPPKCFTSNCIP